MKTHHRSSFIKPLNMAPTFPCRVHLFAIRSMLYTSVFDYFSIIKIFRRGISRLTGTNRQRLNIIFHRLKSFNGSFPENRNFVVHVRKKRCIKTFRLSRNSISSYNDLVLKINGRIFKLIFGIKCNL